MSIIIKILVPDDLALVCTAAPGVFDHSPRQELTAEFLGDPRHHLVAALDKGIVVGFVSAVHYVHPDKAAELWINEVAVASHHQNQGLGRQMLDSMLSLGSKLGCRCAWVLTDSDNTAAMRLYASAGGVPEAKPTVLFEFPLVENSSPD